VAPHSNLNQIQTTIPPLIAQFLLEVCLSRGFTFLGPLSISVPGTSQLDQGYSMITMHQSVKDDKIRSLCLHQDVSQDPPATRGLQSIQVRVKFSCTLAHKGGLQATRNVIQEGIVPTGQPSLVQCVFTIDQNRNSACFTMFSQSWQLTKAGFPHLLRLVKVGNVSMLLFTANLKTPRGRSNI
jgi:hypothetical protein